MPSAEPIFDHQAAVGDFSKALESDPKDPSAVNGRGWSYEQLGKKVKALADYDRAIELEPDWSLPRLNRRNLLWAMGEKQKAVALADQTSLDYTTLGQFQANRGDLKDATTSFNNALKLTPGFVLALDGRCSSYRGLKRYEEALTDSEALVKAEPENAGHLNGLAWDLAYLGHFKKAEPIIQKSLKLRPAEPSSLDTLAYIYAGQGRYEEALDTYDQALAMNSELAASYFGRGKVREKLGQNELAASDFAKAEKLKPGVELRWVAQKP